MSFRIGLIFDYLPSEPFGSDAVAELLKKIANRSEGVRKDLSITLVPFVRSAAMADFVNRTAEAEGYEIEAVTFDEAGVNFSSVTILAQRAHPIFVDQVDFDLGMRVLLARCHVIIVITQDLMEDAKTLSRFVKYKNTFSYVALTRGGINKFLEIDPEPSFTDGPDWVLAVTERWGAMADSMNQPPNTKVTRLGLVFPLFYTAIIRRRSETIKKREPTEAERCESGMGVSTTAAKKLNEGDNISLKATIEAICPYFVRHDSLGRHYSNVFRTICLMVPLLIVFSTLLAVVAGINGGHQDLWHITEAVFLISAAILFIWAKFHNHHRRWIEHRLLTELLRPTVMNTLFHMLPHLEPPTEEPALWIAQTRILLRHLRSLASIEYQSSMEDLRSARVSALEDFSHYQATWHTDFADQHRTAETRLTRLSVFFFIVTLCFCVLQLVFAFSVTHIRPELVMAYQQAVSNIGHGLLMLTLISAGAAFVLVILLHQLGFETIAERSSNASEHFARLHSEIARNGYKADARQIYSWQSECATAILAEQHSWYRQIPLIRVHL